MIKTTLSKRSSNSTLLSPFFNEQDIDNQSLDSTLLDQTAFSQLFFTFLVPFIAGCSSIPLFERLHRSASLSFNLAFCSIAWTQALSIFESHTSYRALGNFGGVASTLRLWVTRRGLRLAACTPLLSLVGQFGVHLCSAGWGHHGWRPHHGLLLGFRTAEKQKDRVNI